MISYSAILSIILLLVLYVLTDFLRLCTLCFSLICKTHLLFLILEFILCVSFSFMFLCFSFSFPESQKGYVLRCSSLLCNNSVSEKFQSTLKIAYIRLCNYLVSWNSCPGSKFTLNVKVSIYKRFIVHVTFSLQDLISQNL